MKMDARIIVAFTAAAVIGASTSAPDVNAVTPGVECEDFYDWVQKLTKSGGGWEYLDWHSTASEHEGFGYWYRGQMTEDRQWPHPEMVAGHFTELDVQEEHPACQDPG